MARHNKTFMDSLKLAVEVSILKIHNFIINMIGIKYGYLKLLIKHEVWTIVQFKTLNPIQIFDVRG